MIRSTCRSGASRFSLVRRTGRGLVHAGLLIALAGCSFAIRAEELVTIAEVSHPPLAEISGITRSAAYPGIYWVHNDSGDVARIFALRSNGEVVLPRYVADRYSANGENPDKPPWPGLQISNASNIDWEDISRIDDTLYVADLGNNGNARRDLGIYVIPEPNPEATEQMRALSFLPVRFPEQQAYPGELWHYDCEALFAADGKLYVLTKHRTAGSITGFERGTRLYRLDTRTTEQPNLLSFVGSNDALTLPTAAETSPDGSLLAVLTYQRVWVFARPSDGSDNWLAAPARTFELPLLRTGIAEGITWQDDATLIIASENRGLFRLPLAELRPAN